MTVPVLFFLLAGLRSLALLFRLRQTREFLAETGTSIGYPGWETFLTEQGSAPFVLTATVFWACLLRIAFIVPILLHCLEFPISR